MINHIIQKDKMTFSYLGEGGYVTHTIAKSDNRYSAVLDALQDQDVETLEEIFNPVIENLDDIEVTQNQVLWRGQKLPEVLVNKLEALATEGVDMEPFRAFMERLSKNPSASSVAELYDFLAYRDLPITEDGYFLAYKGIRADDYSVSGNLNTVVEEGVVNSEGRIRNQVGDKIRVQRNQVDDDRNRHCSFGLHVGSYDYASTFGWDNNMVVVKVDPADAVSVPVDCNFQKLRVCAYEVIAKCKAEISHSATNAEGEGIEGAWNNSSRDEYVAKVSSYLSELADSDEDPEVLGSVILAHVGGTQLALLDALQSLGEYWEVTGDQQDILITIY